MIKFGVIGLGVGERHVATLAKDDRVHQVWVCDFDSKKAERVAKQYGVDNSCTDWRRFLDTGDLDAVIIASYDHDHAEQIIEFLRKGIHLFVEKPLCSTSEELDLIEKAYALACQNSNIHVSTNFILRQEERFKELRNKISSGDLGEIYSVEASYDYGRLHKIVEGWRSQSPNYSVMNGGGIHMIDICQWLLGQKYKPEFALHNKVATTIDQFPAADFTTSLGHLGPNTILKVTANFGSQTPHYHQLKVYGTKGTFINNCGDAIYYFGHEPNVTSIADMNKFPNADKGDLLPNFVGAIAGAGSIDVLFPDLAQVMRVSLEIDRLAVSNL